MVGGKLAYILNFNHIVLHTADILTFEKLQGLTSEFKLNTLKPNNGTYFITNMSRFGLACLPMTAILYFLMLISELFEELQGWNLEFKLITPKSITGTTYDTKQGSFCLAGSAMEAFLKFQMLVS